MRKVKKLNVLAFLIFILSCENATNLKTLNQNYLAKPIEGKIMEIEPGSAGSLDLTLKNKFQKEEVNIKTDYEILMQIKRGDYFKKFANSNKCFIKREDSIIYIDCNQFSDQERDSLGIIQEWKPQEKNKWKLNKN